MTRAIPKCSIFYTQKANELLLKNPNTWFNSVEDADFLPHIHTGSKKILDEVCKKLEIDPLLLVSSPLLRSSN